MLREALSALKSNHGDGIFGDDAKSFFKHVGEINQLFKVHKPLFKDSRGPLWDEFQSLIEDRKRSLDSERSEAESRSHPYRQLIMHELYHADSTDFLNPPIEELKSRSAHHREAGQLLSKHKDDMISAHKTEIFEELNRIRKKLDAYWEAYKEQSQQKREDFVARTQRNIAKNQDRLQKQYTFLSRLEQNLSKNHDQLYDAKGDDFQNTVRGWISETEDKISETRQSIAEIEEWIDEDRRKLSN